MRKLCIAITLFVSAMFNQRIIAQPKQIAGFSEKNALSQFEIEKSFDAQLSAENIGSTIKQLSAKPHHLGSQGSKDVAQSIFNKYKSWGWDVKFETYKVLFPTPKERLLEMTSPTVYKAVLKEMPVKEDATSNQEGQLPTYNAWSADGDVTAELVFVNYGLPQDYEQLQRIGIDVKGKIVIAKYGHSWRGIKPKVAYEHGAIGCIIYSDPKDDGYTAGDVYPKGAYKNEYGVQRGSVMDMVIYPGDPLTPGIGATENAARLDRKDAPTILKIPVLPISYHDAKPLLEAMEGPVAPADWAGSLPITYHIGPGKTKVHLKLAFNWDMVTAYNVIATIKGSEYPDEWVVRGNHHDAWVNGANDPLSGQAALLEEAKAIGTLLKTGWKPKRTIVYCAWDGEEPSLLGSTEWVEDHAKELQQKVVTYINSDGNGRGFLSAEGSHALEKMVSEISKEIKDPQTGVSVFERKKAEDVVKAATAKLKQEKQAVTIFPLGAMGAGSDYSAFIQHLGIPSLDLGYGGENQGGEYHSIFDSYDDYRRFKDPTFAYGVALSQTAGRAVLRLANAEVLPFDFRNLHKAISSYVSDLISKTDALRESTLIENDIIKKNQYKLSDDPTEHLKPIATKEEVPYFDFSVLQNALSALQKTANQLEEVSKKVINSSSDKAKFNEALYQAEKQLLSEQGLPRRPWFKHTIYAPGFYTGYGVKTMPGIREAIEQRNWKEANEQIAIDATAIYQLNNYLQKVIAMF